MNIKFNTNYTGSIRASVVTEIVRGDLEFPGDGLMWFALAPTENGYGALYTFDEHQTFPEVGDYVVVFGELEDQQRFHVTKAMFEQLFVQE